MPIDYTSNRISALAVTVFEYAPGGGRAADREEPTENIKHLGIDYSPRGKNFTIKLTNKIERHIDFLCLNIKIMTEDERHISYARRPLYQPESGSKESHMSDSLEPEEEVATFRVNIDGVVRTENRLRWLPDNSKVPVLEPYLRKGREYLYIVPQISYRLRRESEERYQTISQGFQKIRVWPAVKHQPLPDILEKSGKMSHNELDAIRNEGEHSRDELSGGVSLSLFGKHFLKEGTPIYD